MLAGGTEQQPDKDVAWEGGFYRRRETRPLNIWALRKEVTIRVALLRLSAGHGTEKLLLNCPVEPNPCAVWIGHREIPGLNAYLFTYAQPQGCYGLQLGYPGGDMDFVPPYPPLEAIRLKKLIEQLVIHFEL